MLVDRHSLFIYENVNKKYSSDASQEMDAIDIVSMLQWNIAILS